MVRYSAPPDFWGEPLAALRRIQEEINRAFNESRVGGGGEFPPVNLWRGDGGLLLMAEVPGVPLDNLEITVHQNTVTVKGKRAQEVPAQEATYHRHERALGNFARTVTLPYIVDADRVKASVANGVLTLALPRPESDKPKKIHITTAS